MKNIVKQRRESLDMTQEDLAKKSNVSRQTISSIENNQLENIESKTMFKLATALGCGIGDIFFDNFVVYKQQNLTEKESG